MIYRNDRGTTFVERSRMVSQQNRRPVLVLGFVRVLTHAYTHARATISARGIHWPSEGQGWTIHINAHPCRRVAKLRTCIPCIRPALLRKTLRPSQEPEIVRLVLSQSIEQLIFTCTVINIVQLIQRECK